MQDLVFVDNNQPVTSSRKVAEHFDKRHGDVMRSIEDMRNGAEEEDQRKIASMFYATTEPDAYGREQKVYYMHEEGFSLLVMGFTGAKALSWKLKFIDAFKEMRKQLSVPQLKPNPHYRTRMVKTAVTDIGGTAQAIMLTYHVKPGMALAAAQEMVGKAYGIDTTPLQRLIPAEENPGYLNATMIAEKMGLKYKTGRSDPAKANKLLESAGLQERRGDKWRLTEKGKAYGEEKPYTRNGHSDYQIVWNDSVFDALGVQ